MDGPVTSHAQTHHFSAGALELVVASLMSQNGIAYEESGHKRVLKARHVAEQENEPRISTFLRGSIKRLTISNFMTFSEASADFDSQLNVIVAPNGTGKSSLVCALCIGLGGRPQLLGRQSHLADFVRRGADSAEIQVTLSGGDGCPDTMIKRTVFADGGPSEWKLDGCQASLKDIERFVKSMNIQLDNLLQFMPQDRVSEFASLSPVQLLEETEKSIDRQLWEKHVELISMGRTLTESNTRTKSLENDLRRVTGQMRSLERDVDRLRQLANLNTETSQIEAKLQMLAIDKIKEDLESSTSHMRIGENEIRNKQEQLRVLSNQLLSVRKVKGRCQKECTTFTANVTQSESENSMMLDQITDYEESIENKMNDLKHLEDQSLRLKEKINELKVRTKALEDEMHQEPGISEERLSRLDTLKKEYIDRRQQVIAAQSEVEAVAYRKEQLLREQNQLHSQMKRLDDSKVRVVRLLEKRRPLFNGLAEAYESLKHHRHKFQMPVVGPLITEVTVKDEIIARYLECQVPLTTWTLFIVRCEEDKRMLKSLRLMNEINIINIGNNGEARYDPPEFHDLSRFGVFGCLLDYFEASDAVKSVLDAECGLSGSVVGSEEAGAYAMELFASDRRIYRLFVPSRYYTTTRSKFSNNKSLSTNQFSAARLLGSSHVTSNERSDLDEKLMKVQERLKAIENDERSKAHAFMELESEYNAVKQELEDINQEKRAAEKRALFHQRRMAETAKELHRLQNLPDPITMEEKLKREISQLQGTFLEKIQAVRCGVVQLGHQHEKLVVKKLLLKEAEKRLSIAQEKADTLGKKVDEQRRNVDELRSIVKGDRLRLRRAESALNEKFPDISDWMECIERLPSDTEELEDLANTKRYEAATLTCNNPDAMTTYEQLKLQMTTLEGQLVLSNEELERVRRNVGQAKETWLSELKHAISKINEAFTDNFLAIRCIGEVSLQGEKAHALEFHKYALEIKVKFRDAEPLTVLDAVRQSGGERMVATTLYLLSLQAVSQIPFRVMDEINHGMDEENERRVMDILVNKTGSERMPQTILLSPKMFTKPEFVMPASNYTIGNGRVMKP